MAFLKTCRARRGGVCLSAKCMRRCSHTDTFGIVAARSARSSLPISAECSNGWLVHHWLELLAFPWRCGWPNATPGLVWNSTHGGEISHDGLHRRQVRLQSLNADSDSEGQVPHPVDPERPPKGFTNAAALGAMGAGASWGLLSALCLPDLPPHLPPAKPPGRPHQSRPLPMRIL